LATLLEPEAFLAALSACRPEADFESARITYVKYKPGTNCLVGYQLEVAGASLDVYAKAYPCTAQNKLRKAREQPSVPGPLGPGRIVLEDCAVVVSVFPNDSKVTTLACVADAEARERVLRELVPNRPDLWGGTVQRLVYKPERRYVGRVITDDGPRAALKVYTEDEYCASRRNGEAFQSHGPFRIAPLLGRSDSHRMLAFEWLPERPLSEVISDPELDLNAVAIAGAGIAALHAQEPQGLACRSRQTEAAGLVSEATWLGFVCPRLASQAAALAQRLAARLMREPALDRPIHGDLHARQVLLGGGTVTILDLDRAVRGDPAADLGNFIAHLQREVVRGNLPPGRVDRLKHALLEGYRAATGRAIPAQLDLYIAAGLFGLALRFFRYAEPEWAERAAATLERAEAILKA
jgi:streptomycin 6-kinase